MATVEERLAALEAQAAELKAGLDPQRIRDSLEYTWNPRGTADEVRAQDAAGLLLPIRKRIQFLGGATDDPANARTVVAAGGGSGSPLVPFPAWNDPFTTDQLATAYTGVTGFTVSGGVLNPATSGASTAYLSNSALYGRNMIMQCKVDISARNSSNDDTYVQLVARSTTEPTTLWAYARYWFWRTTGGSTKPVIRIAVNDNGTDIEATSPSAIGGDVADPAVPIYLRFGVYDGELSASWYITDPLAGPTTGTNLRQTVAISAGRDSRTSSRFADMLTTQPGVEAKLTSASVSDITIDDFKVWHV
jgi:hypothetical protein